MTYNRLTARCRWALALAVDGAADHRLAYSLELLWELRAPLEA